MNNEDVSRFNILITSNKKVQLLMVIICCSVMIPISVKNFLVGHHLLGVSLSAFVVTLLIDVVVLHVNGKILIHYSIIASLLVFSILLALIDTGMLAIFWFFPVSIAFIFVLPTAPSNILNSILIVGGSVISFDQFGVGISSRFTLALLFSFTIVTILLGIVTSLSDKLRDQSIKDPMTGALNRRQLFYYLDDCLAHKNRFDVSAEIILFDIDDFKIINDSLGHAVGDRVIKKVSDLILINTRETDLFFRIGGDEFLLLSRNTNLQDACQLANKIRQLINDEFVDEKLSVSVSVGVSGVSKGSSSTEWMEWADSALYQAKHAGRNCVEVYEYNAT